MRLFRVTAAVVLFACVSAPAAADTVEGTRYAIEERADRAKVLLDRGFATIVVDRVVANDGPRSDQAVFHLDLPEGAVATRLRTSGIDRDGRPVWFEGDLMDAEEAAAKYLELTGIGGYYPKDPALLSWRGRRQLALQVFPVPARATKTVEYTLVLPMRYEAGQYLLDLSPLGTQEVPALVRVDVAHPGDTFRVNGVPLGQETSVAASRDLAIEMRPGSGPPLGVELAAVLLGDKRIFVRARAAAAPRLAEVPAHAAVAIVLDVSRSMRDQAAAEVVAARAYLASFKDAEVTIVLFDRRVRVPFGASIPASEASAHLSAFEPELGNGSQVDDAVATADAILSRSASPTRRMLILTDLLTRETLTPSFLSALTLKSGALVHLATVASSGTELTRDDESPWGALPRRTGGVFWHARAENMGAEARDVFEEWARPKRLDHVKLEGFPAGYSLPDVLPEGTEVQYLGVADTAPSVVVLSGDLWSTPTRVSAASTPEEERRWSALVFGSPEADGLSEAEQRVLATRGHAVSPVTSFLAIEPGVRPSTDGLDRLEGSGEGGGGTGFGMGLGRMGTIGHGAGRAIDPQRFLADRLGVAWRTCGGRGHASVKLESTLDEVVAVPVPTVAVPSEHASNCLREAVWSLDLPSVFAADHETWTVEVDG
jgi:von Willebrand factor type A domain